MKNKTIANWLMAVLVWAVIGGVFGMSEEWTQILGLALFATAITAIVRLYKSE